MYIADVCHPLLSDNLSFQRLTHIHTTVYLCDTQVRSLVVSPEKTVGSPHSSIHERWFVCSSRSPLQAVQPQLLAKKLQSSLAAYGDVLLMVLVGKVLTREEEDGRSGHAPSSPRRPTSSAVGGVCCRMRVEHLHSVIVVSYLVRSFFSQTANDHEVDRCSHHILKHGDGVLRVALNTRVALWRVVSVLFDRSMRGELK